VRRRALTGSAVNGRSDSERSGTALVWGDRDLAATLHAAGIPVAAVAGRSKTLRYSRYARDWVGDPDSGQDALVETLLRYATSQMEPVVLYYQTDDALLMLSRRRQELSAGFRFVLAEPDLVEKLVDKAAFSQLAARLDLPTPQTLVLAVTDETREVEQLDWPALVKPVRREGSWEGNCAAKAVLVADRKELQDLLTTLRPTHSHVLVQEYIAGPEAQVESYHVYVDSSGATVGEFTGRKLRTYPTAYGYSTALVTSQAEDVVNVGRDIVSKLGMTGVAKLDFKRDFNGKLWLLEVNPRFNLWHRLAAAAGLNIPALVFADLLGLPRPQTSPVRAGVRYCRMRQDWQAAREEGVGTLAWLRFVAGCEVKSDVDLSDTPALIRAKIVAPSLERLRRIHSGRPG
jgi:D-aspartate ligase